MEAGKQAIFFVLASSRLRGKELSLDAKSLESARALAPQSRRRWPKSSRSLTGLSKYPESYGQLQ